MCLVLGLGDTIARLPVLSWSRAETKELLRKLDDSDGLPESALLEWLVKCRCGRVMTRGAVRVHVCEPSAGESSIEYA